MRAGESSQPQRQQPVAFNVFVFSLFTTTREKKSTSMDPLVAAIDQGTSSTRFLVSDVVGSAKC